MQARRLCEGVDLKDTPFVSLTLHLDARLWTVDEELKTGLCAKGFDQFFEPKVNRRARESNQDFPDS